MDQVVTIGGIAGGISFLAAIVYLLSKAFVKRKTSVEAADIITQASGRLVLDLERQIADLKKRLDEKDL